VAPVLLGDVDLDLTGNSRLLARLLFSPWPTLFIMGSQEQGRDWLQNETLVLNRVWERATHGSAEFSIRLLQAA
jgi:hypothetical protein